MESQLSKVEEEKLKLLMETGDYKSTVQTLKEELDESKHKIARLDKEKASLQERLKAEELIREKVGTVFLEIPSLFCLTLTVKNQKYHFSFG